jgi:16S rRNA U516 pseudouridylate synthase RsuA-like enzyme
MCEAVGHPVRKLKRVRLAFLTLEGVPEGGYRPLTAEEVARLYAL